MKRRDAQAIAAEVVFMRGEVMGHMVPFPEVSQKIEAHWRKEFTELILKVARERGI